MAKTTKPANQKSPTKGGRASSSVAAASAGAAVAAVRQTARQCYERYDPLWYLQRIGARSTVPDDGQPTRVALIDTGVCLDHPYLDGRVDRDLSIDFGALPYGLSYRRSAKPYTLQFRTNLLEKLALGDSHDVIAKIMAEANGKTVTRADRTSLQRRFSSHGTAVAGLIAASPPKPGQGPIVPSLEYFGADRLSTVVSIATSLQPSPQQLIIAVLYALQNGADVIVIPRGISTDWQNPEPDHAYPSDESAAESARLLGQGLEDLLISVSELVPVVCAAGNSSMDQLDYPAVLSDRCGNNGIVAVGAASYLGRRSAYSNYGAGLTLVAPSDDAEVLNRHQVRLDKCSRRYRLHPYSTYEGSPIEVPYSHQSILALDVPGVAGYAGRGQSGIDEDDPVNELFDTTGGAFALFGGTSAACAMVAGVISQLVRKARSQKLPLDGPAIKKILADTCVKRSVHNGGTWELLPDDINGDPPADHDARIRQLFGHGLVNLPAALKAIDSYAVKAGPS